MCLIREFEKRPELYDRNCPQFKDKALIDEMWAEIAHNLGYELNIVKDRMLQLRNRYHIEKRRIENLQAEYPKRPAESKWLLFEHLSFLSDHIPVRRSFRTMHSRRTYGDYAVKNEQGTDVETDIEHREDAGSDYLPGARKGSIQIRSYGNLISSKDGSNKNQPNAIRNAQYVPPLPRLTRMPRGSYAPRQTHSQVAYQRAPAEPENQLPSGAEKFLAFGRFLTSSLIELPENEALLLVNQFTSELVQSYLKKHDQTEHRENAEQQLDEFIDSNGHISVDGDELQME